MRSGGELRSGGARSKGPIDGAAWALFIRRPDVKKASADGDTAGTGPVFDGVAELFRITASLTCRRSLNVSDRGADRGVSFTGS